MAPVILTSLDVIISYASGGMNGGINGGIAGGVSDGEFLTGLIGRWMQLKKLMIAGKHVLSAARYLKLGRSTVLA